MLKYIIVKDQNETEHAIIFPSGLNHMDVANCHTDNGLRVVSAGLCYIGENPVSFGRSETLNLNSTSHDSEVLRRDFTTKAIQR